MNRLRSWRTSLSGIASIASGAGVCLRVLGDEGGIFANVEAFLSGVGLILTGIGLLAARDNLVSSQDVGVRPIAPAAQFPRGNPAKQ